MAETETKTNERKDRLKEITDSIEAGIKGIFESGKYQEYLRTMSRFHRYSVNNVMLIHMQKPSATLVAGFDKWKNSFGRRVKKGEKGIKIIAPTPFNKKVLEQKIDPATKLPMQDEKGQPIMEEKEIRIPLYKVVTVFDVSQTEGKPLPQLSSDLTGTVKDFDIFMEAMKRSCPVPMSIEPMAPDMDGFFSLTEQRVALREGMSEVQTACAGIHEIAHARLHNYAKTKEVAAADKEGAAPPRKDAQTQEIEAESVAYAVCQFFGIETGENSFGYLASWSKDKDNKVLRASLETINKTANALISDMERNIALIQKERDMAQEQTQEENSPHNAASLESDTAQPSQEAQDEALFLVDEAVYLHVQATDENEGWDYTLYDAKTGKDLDGGVLEMPELDLQAAAVTICLNHTLNHEKIQAADLSLAHNLQIGEFKPVNDHDEKPVEHTLPDEERPEVTLDTYPMPDKALTMDDLKKAGYDGDDLVPISREMALTYLEEGVPIYTVSEGWTNMFFAGDDVDNIPAGAVFTMLRSDWEDSDLFHEMVNDRIINHQQEREAALKAYPGDAFAIFQMKADSPTGMFHFRSWSEVEQAGVELKRDHYSLVYTAPLPAEMGDGLKPLEAIWEKFNTDRPHDFFGYSLSMSDIVALKRGGVITCHYVDEVGYREMPNFLPPTNPLENAEKTVEDDMNMIDGLINNGSKEPTVAELEQQAKSGHPISLMDLAAAVHREEAAKTSIMGKLQRKPPQPEHKAPGPKKEHGKEI